MLGGIVAQKGSQMINTVIINWRKARYSSDITGTDCVETGWTTTTVGYRDSKQPGGPELLFPTGAVRVFLTSIRIDEVMR